MLGVAEMILLLLAMWALPLGIVVAVVAAIRQRPRPPAPRPLVHRLHELDELLADGTISAEEHESARAHALASS